MSGTRANTIADRNPHSMRAPDSRVNPPTCTKFADEPQFVALHLTGGRLLQLPRGREWLVAPLFLAGARVRLHR